MQTKLPKQWSYWAAKYHIKPHVRPGCKRRGRTVLVGRDRHWRVNCYGVFECSCPLEHFDRWANSRGAEASRIPQTEQEFKATIAQLIKESAHAK